VLEIRRQDSPADDPIWFHLCNQVKTLYTIHHDEAHASHLLLPVIPR